MSLFILYFDYKNVWFGDYFYGFELTLHSMQRAEFSILLLSHTIQHRPAQQQETSAHALLPDQTFHARGKDETVPRSESNQHT